MRHICAVLLTTSVAGAVAVFEPARLIGGEPPPVGLHAVGWTAELVVARVNPSGRVRDIVARTPDTMLTNVIGGWTFEPARYEKMPEPAQVLVAAIMRPPTFPDIAGPPDLAREASWLPATVPRIVYSATPPYPARGMGSAAVVVEMLVSVAGAVERTRVVGAETGFAEAATRAASSWQFEPARREGTAVPAFVYAVFGFREPVVITPPIPPKPPGPGGTLNPRG